MDLNSVIQSARLYYVFSFAFSRIPLKEMISVSETDTQRPLGELLEQELQIGRPDYYPPPRWHQSEEEEPPESRAALYAPFHHLSISTRDEPVEVDGIGPATRRTHIALFESGMGVLWVMLESTGGALTPSQISHAANRRSFPKVSSVAADKNDTAQIRSPQSIFMDEIHSLISSINHAIAKLSPESQQLLSGKYSPLTPDPEIAEDALLEPPSADDFRITWVDTASDLLWRDPSDEQGRRGAYEEPCVAILLKTTTDFRDAVDHGSTKHGDAEKFVAQLLHACAEEYLDASHAVEYRGDKLTSLFPDRRFRTFAHGNCLLVLHSEENNLELVRFVQGLFRTYCALRGSWHMNAVVNEQLDHCIELLLAQFSRIARDALDVGSALMKKQIAIINAKGRFLSALATEDPLTWGVGLTPFGPLYEECIEIFRLDQLRQTVKFKLRELDHLFDMISSFQLRYGLRSRRTPAQRRAKVLLALFGTCCVASTVFRGEVIKSLFDSSLVGMLAIVGLLILGLGCIVTPLFLGQRPTYSRQAPASQPGG